MSNNISNKKNSANGLIRPRSGFTLVEVITALFIILVGILSGFTLVTQTITASKKISMQLTAAYLGKEGIEIVKNIRDSNYLKIHFNDEDAANWTDGLYDASLDCSPAAGGCGASYDSTELAAGYAGQPLKYSAETGLFGYSQGTDTPYKRTITVEPYSGDPVEGDYLEVRVTVAWSERGVNHATVVRENIYNWWPQD